MAPLSPNPPVTCQGVRRPWVLGEVGSLLLISQMRALGRFCSSHTCLFANTGSWARPWSDPAEEGIVLVTAPQEVRLWPTVLGTWHWLPSELPGNTEVLGAFRFVGFPDPTLSHSLGGVCAPLPPSRPCPLQSFCHAPERETFHPGGPAFSEELGAGRCVKRTGPLPCRQGSRVPPR